VGSGVSIAAFGAVLMLAVGIGFYGIDVEFGRVLPAVVTFVVGVASFAMLGLALTAVAPSAQGAPALAQATILPAAFVSDVFIPLGEDPARWMVLLGDFLPLKPFVHSFFAPFDPFRVGSAWEPEHLLAIAAWGFFGAAIATWRFRWEPSVGSEGFRGRRSRRAQSLD